MQHDPDPFADQPDRGRVAVGADRYLAIAVAPRCEQPARLERLIEWPHQQRLFDRESFGDGPGSGTDPAGAVLPVPRLDHLVRLGERGDLGNRNDAFAAEVPDLALEPAFLVDAFDAGPTVEDLDTDTPVSSRILKGAWDEPTAS
ncbi:hypothetical protein NRF20_45195 [Streptomyces sp. R-74717]|uniref:hypothetical protein n=1 Tax=Streptomyces sp. R-74717 TaxID=2969820 RepID=UPI0039B3DA22